MLIRLIRKLLWRILGIDYAHMLRVIDYVYLDKDKYTSIGTGTYNNGAVVYRWSDSPLIIGKYCSISYGVKFIMDDASHQFNTISTYPFVSNSVTDKRGIIIGNDVWIGMNVIVKHGVRIGDGATIAAGAVVTSDVAPYTVVGGVPAKLLKEKCTHEESNAMQRIAWWNWKQDIIYDRIADFKLPYIDFINKYKNEQVIAVR